MLVNPLDLDLWIANDWNVLFTGKHGVGKTSIILDAFEKNDLKWMYFSASTMDPWVDFIGVPKEKGEGDDTYLGLVRPERFHNDEVEAIMMDEFNRSHKKVRNAVMEHIQFKSINGKKFNNLRMVWAAINPEEDEDDLDSLVYDVEPIDPAQKDRFQIQIDIPYRCDKTYFTSKYDSDWSTAAIDWWNKLSKEQKDLVSPRRLDYALSVHQKGGNIRHVMPNGVNVTMLVNKLTIGNMAKFVAGLKDDEKKAKQWLRNRTNFDMARNELMKPDNFGFFIPFFPKEEISNYICDTTKKGKEFRKKFLTEDFLSVNDELRSILSEILVANRRNTSRDFRPIKESLEKLRDKPKIIPKECVAFKTFLRNTNEKMSKKIDYVESISPSQSILPQINYYNSNPTMTQYNKRFLELLVQNFTFKMSEDECTILVDIMFELLKSFQISTIRSCDSFAIAFVLVMKSIEKNNFGHSLEAFHFCLKNINKSLKEKFKEALKSKFDVSDFDLDRFIEAESFTQ